MLERADSAAGTASTCRVLQVTANSVVKQNGGIFGTEVVFDTGGRSQLFCQRSRLL